jgi:metallo-beta-lactamase family protein
MRISFHGAAGGVTGSCHLIECDGIKILIDCGLFQGGRESEEENSEPLGFDPREIDYLLLTHAHLDHCGRIPLLQKRGFHGEIITTAPTRELARLVLMDSAHIHEEDARRRQRHHQNHKHGRGAHGNADEPLYGILDALNSFDHFGRCAVYGETISISKNIEATFGDAGHILGSAWIRLNLREGNEKRTVLFSGDLGSRGRPVLHDPVAPPKTDTVVIETTYGDRLHKSLDNSIDEFYEAINHTIEHGGNAIIPTFALDRAQEILYFIKLGEMQGKLPKGVPVFLDSPMAITATEIYRRYPDFYKPEVRALFENSTDPFHPSELRITRETSESIALNSISGAVILAGSGMCTGGRVRHHLVHNISRRDSSIIFVGYAAERTLARVIVDGAKEVHIFGERHKVRASVHTINGFSAHADKQELLDWYGNAHTGTTYLVHGEQASMENFAGELSGTVRIPKLHQKFGL